MVTLLNAGCGSSESQPSYADLVVVYNAELETLDRLERKRAELVATYEQQFRPDAEDALAAITGALSAAGEANRQIGAESAADPHDALDQAIESAMNVQQATSQVLEAATEQAGAEGGSTGSLAAHYSEEFKLQLASLDKEIDEQKARVERARQARDAAEVQ